MSNPNLLAMQLAQAQNDPLQLARFLTTSGNWEDIDQDFYDRVNYAAAGQATVSFCATPVGQSATLNQAGTNASKTKTLRDTNFIEPQKISSLFHFLLIGFSVTYFPLVHTVAAANSQRIMDDMQLLSDQGALNVKIISKSYLDMPLARVPSTGNVFRGTVGGAFTAGNVWVSAGGYGSGSPTDYYPLKVPLAVPAGGTIQPTMTFDGSPALGQTFDLQLTLHGYLRRLVQ